MLASLFCCCVFTFLVRKQLLVFVMKCWYSFAMLFYLVFLTFWWVCDPLKGYQIIPRTFDFTRTVEGHSPQTFNSAWPVKGQSSFPLTFDSTRTIYGHFLPDIRFHANSVRPFPLDIQFRANISDFTVMEIKANS